MIRLRGDGLVRSIGVSDFTAEHIDRLERETGVLPAVNRIETHPLFPQEELRRFLADKGVAVESWSPLDRGSTLLEDPAVAAAAAAHDRTPGQVVPRGHTQLGAVPVPRSGNPDRRRDNLDLFSFSPTPEEMAAGADRPHKRLGGDPEQHEEF
jgi:2,5-diketo-D-gluconate reductase A